LAPGHDFGRLFNSDSDLDLSVISDHLFNRVAAAASQFSRDFKDGTIQPRTDYERALWEANVAFGERNLPRGFFDPNKIPNLNRYPLVQGISQSMWSLVARLSATAGAPKVKRASIRVYRDWQSFIRRVSVNLQAAIT
jgi:hypothetical protein